MELELGLKITKLRDDLTSTDFRIAKDSAGLLFLSSETENMFILTAHLKGFRKENIKIDINEEGTRIAVCGDKAIQEMVMVGWTMHKKEVEIWTFKKVFQIPDGVVLDRIKAKFNDEEAVLTIRMPKSVKGIRGVGIEEVREEVAQRSESEMTKTLATEEIETLLEHALKEQEVKAGEEIEKVMEKLPQASEIAHGKESEETFPEKVKPAPATTAYQGTEITKETEVEQERTLEKQEPTEQSKTEETCTAELSDFIEKVKEKIPEAESEKTEVGSEVMARDLKTDESTKNVEEQVFEQAETPSAQQAKVEKENTKGQISQVETQMQKQNSVKREIQEQMEAKPDQEIEEATATLDLPANQANKNEEATRKEEIQGMGDKTQEEKTNQVELPQEKQVETHEPSEAGKKEGLSHEATERGKPGSKMSKLFPPCFYAGSAFLVTLIVVVVHLIRSKKR